MWRVLEEAVDWFVLRDGAFVSLPMRPDGAYHSETFPGLWLDPAALIAADRDRIRTALAQGLASPEHAAFVAELRRRMGGSA